MGRRMKAAVQRQDDGLGKNRQAGPVRWLQAKSGWLLRALLFLYGGGVHLAMLRIFVHWGYPTGEGAEFANHPMTNVGVTALGGIFVSIFMVRAMPQQELCTVRDASKAILRFGGLALKATVFALEAFFLVSSVFLAAPNAKQGLWSFVIVIFYWFLGLQSYGLGVIIIGAPFAFGYGTLLGILFLTLSPRLRGTRVPPHEG